MAEPGPVADISAISYRFAVMWSVPAEKLRYQLPLPGQKAIPIVVNSPIYRFKDIQNLEFSFLLMCTQNTNQSPHRQNDYKMAVNCTLGLPIYLEDALVLIEDSIYRVECEGRSNTHKKLVFSSMVLAQDRFRDEKVTFRCIMSVPGKVNAVLSNSTEDPPMQDIVNCEAIVCDPGVHPNGYDDVSEFLFSSRIPDFNVDMAMRMLRETHSRGIPVLKALCVEYLMENLTSENVVSVLQKSIESDTKDLSRKCVKFLSEQCRISARGFDLDNSLGS